MPKTKKINLLKPTKLLSVIIPARTEFPNIIHTIYSILHCWEADGFHKNELEIIIVDNGSTDNNFWPQKGTKGTTSYIFPRGMYAGGVVRVLFDPICGNHSARNKGAKIALGEYLYFSDAHMALRPGFFKKMLTTCKETGGLIHGSVQWMGAYPPHDGGMGYGYTIKLGEEWKGTWNNYKVSATPFAVPSQGHWGVMVNKEQFLSFGGYPDVHRTYGGGEFFLDCLWWMMGSCVITVPDAIGYHLASGRGYSYHHDDYIHNVFNCGYAIGAEDWIERAYLNYMRRGRKEVLDRMMAESIVEMADRRLKIERERTMTFNEMLVKRPWDEWNLAKHGRKQSSMSIFHWSWLELLLKAPEYVQEAYKKSLYQKRLQEFIETELSTYIYKADKYSNERKEELRKLI